MRTRHPWRTAPLATLVSLLLLASCGGGGGGPPPALGPYLQAPALNASFGVDPADRRGGVLLHSGELCLQREDLAVPARALGFQLVRTYVSLTGASGPLGPGWSCNWFEHLVEQPGGDVEHHVGDGRRFLYTALGGGAYASPAGFFTSLARDGTGYGLRDAHGLQRRFALDGRLLWIRNRLGDLVELQYTGAQLTTVLDEMGRSYSFGYDGVGRLQDVTDFTGRQVRYDYDAAGRLVSARSPLVTGTVTGNDFPAGRTERYAYMTGGGDPRLDDNLVAVIAPREVADATLTPFLQATYGTSGHVVDRVTALALGGTNASGVAAGGSFAYAYDFAPSGGPSGTASRTTVTDRRGQVTRYDHNASGHMLRAVESPAGGAFTTTCEYDAHGQLTGLVYPLGNELRFVYDSANPDRFQQGNLLRIRRLPDAGRGGAPAELVTTYTYEPLYNLVRTVTSPRGNDASYVPQNGGAQSAARYTTTTAYDWQEAAVPPPEAADWGIVIPAGLLALGDLNEDGRTDQAHGLAVRIDLPTVHLDPAGKQAAAEGDAAQERVVRLQYNDFGQRVREEDPRGNVDVFTFHPEQDPDGDGAGITPGRDASTGGYLAAEIEDAVLGPRRQDAGPALALTTSHLYDPRGNCIRRADPRGFAWTMTFNTLDEPVRCETPKLHASQTDGYLRDWIYDANGSVVEVRVENETTDPASHLPTAGGGPAFFVTTYTYDILDRRVRQVQDATRDPAIPASAEPQSLVTELRYDANENLVRLRSPRAVAGADPENQSTFTYDARDLMVEQTRGGASPEASTIRFEYDGNRNRTRILDAEGSDPTVQAYDGYDRCVEILDRTGTQYEQTFDPEGRPLRATVRGPAVSGGALVLLEGTERLYDEAGRLFGVDRDLFLPVAPASGAGVADGPLRPGDGKVNERYEFDALGRRTFRITDDLACWAATYDGADRETRSTTPLADPSGPTPTETAYAYDAAGNVIRRDETHSSPESLVPPVVLTTHYVYDAMDRQVRSTDPLGQTRYTEYDSRNNVVAVYDAQGSAIADPLGLYAGSINAPGNATRFAYDGLDRRWLTVRELRVGGEGSMPLDTSNPAIPTGLVEIVETYDANGRVATRTDANGSTTTYSYDALDRMVQQQNPEGGTRSFSYDHDGNRTLTTDENGSQHAYTYDANNRLVRHEITPGPGLLPGTALPALVGTTLRTYEYDGLGRVIHSFDGNDPGTTADDAVVVTRYDSLSRIVEEVQGGLAVGCSYASDNRVELLYPGAGRVVHYAYDAADQCVEISNVTSLSVSTNWIGIGCPPLRRTCWNPTPSPTAIQVQTWALNPRKLVVGSSTQTPAGTIAQEVVARARDDAIVQQQQVMQDNVASQIGIQHDWDLSSLNQVVGNQRTLALNGVPTTTGHDVRYGPAQEILRVADRFAPVTQTRTFDAAYQRTDGAFVYVAQGGGLRLADATFLYQWDGLDRLRAVRLRSSPSTVVATYDYDASPAVHGGRRVGRALAAGGSTTFVYDGDHVIEERTGSGQVARQFLYGGAGTDDVVAMDADTNADGDPDALYFYGRDANGNVTHLVDAGGTPVEFYAYDHLKGPEILAAATLAPLPASAVGNPFLFTGRRYDAETGLYHYRARQYDPQAGEFLSRDPMGSWGDASNDGNPMAYCANDPWNRTDPSGLDPWGDIGDAMAAADWQPDSSGKSWSETLWDSIPQPGRIAFGLGSLGPTSAGGWKGSLWVAAGAGKYVSSQGAIFLRHYLSMKGTAMHVDVDDMLAEMPGFKAKYEEAAQQAEDLLRARLDEMCGGPSPQTIVVRNSLTFHGTENQPEGSYTALRSESYEYWLALQSFAYSGSARGIATRIATNGICSTWSVNVHYVFRVHDTYDFAVSGIGRELVAAGKAKVFEVYGMKVEQWQFTHECCSKCKMPKHHSGSVDPPK